MSVVTRRVAVRLLGSMSWATVDQVMFAASNFVFTVAVARGLGTDGLGRFTLAFTAYITALGFVRSLVSEPLLADPRRDHDREVEGASVTLTLAYACAAAVVVAAIGAVAERVEFLVVAAALPLVLLQDLLRYHGFRRKAPRLAAVLDGGWLVGSLAAWPIVTTTGSVAVCAACWATGALVGVAAGWRAARITIVGLGVAFGWWSRHARRLALPLVLDSVLVTVATQTVVILLAAEYGDAALGTLRAGQVYFAPLGMVFVAFGVLAVPHLAQRAAPASTALAFTVSGGLAVFAGLACGLILVVEPVLGAVLYDDAVAVPGWLLVPVAVQTVVAAASSGLVMVCKARGRGAAIVWARTSSTALGVVLVVALSIPFGISGALWALAAQSVAYAVDLAIRVIHHPAPLRAGEEIFDA
jgi:O-antigen/teichoic acid export membrane protein